MVVAGQRNEPSLDEVRVTPQTAGHGVPIHLREADVEQNDVRSNAPREIDGLHGAVNDFYVMPIQTQQHAERVGCVDIVVYDKDAPTEDAAAGMCVARRIMRDRDQRQANRERRSGAYAATFDVDAAPV